MIQYIVSQERKIVDNEAMELNLFHDLKKNEEKDLFITMSFIHTRVIIKKNVLGYYIQYPRKIRIGKI